MLSQCKKPSGRFGRFLTRGMNFGHSGLTRWGLGFIDIASDIDALDIGCGGGRTVERLAGIVTDGKVVGIDYSPDAVVVARKKNRALINEGRVEIFQEAVSSMRFSDGAFGLITAFERVEGVHRQSVICFCRKGNDTALTQNTNSSFYRSP